MYKVLYRKWRPKIFDDIVGQNQITNILKSQISSKRISHALMFCGVRGTGKTSCAKIFAKAVNCLNNKNGNPCLNCEMCKKIEKSSVLDVLEIDAASNNSVENIRLIREESNLVPSEATYRVYIIDEFHMLSSGAFNAFLRTLEEPAKNVIFILATTEYHKIPKTIISRCQKFDFRMINENSIYSRLKFVSDQEKIPIDEDSLRLISKSAEGSMRDALSILEQCANCDQGKLDVNVVRKTLGLSDSSKVEEIVSYVLSSDLKNSLDILHDLYSQGKNMIYVCEMIMSFFHDLFCYKSSSIIFESCLFNKEKISELSLSFSLSFFLKCFDVLKNSYIQIKNSPNPLYEIDEAIIKIFNGVDSNKEKLKVEFKGESQKNESNNKLNNDWELQSLDCWNDIIESINSKVSSSLSFLLKGTNAYILNNSIMVDTNDFVFSMIKKSKTEIEKIIFDKTNKNYQINKLESDRSVCNENKLDIKYLEDKAKSSNIEFDIN